MGKICDRETCRFFVFAVFLTAAVLLCGNLLQNVIVRRQREAHQQSVAALLGNVTAKYPKVREEEWIALLNGTENLEAGRELMMRYGILEGRETFEIQERYIRQSEWVMNGCIAALFAALAALLCGFLYQRQRRLKELELYLQRVTKGHYELEPEKQRDSELSALKNELYKVVVLLREQTERLREQKKALANSVSDISHQLKTPLTSAMVLADNLSESENMSEETRRHFLAEIIAQIGGMSWLVATMLKLSRLDAGVVELEKKELSGRELLLKVADVMEQQAEWREVSLEVRAEQDFGICGDGRWLREALSNIVKNGVEHSPRQGKVVMSLCENAVYTEISVQNYGAVISEEEQKHIFERFYRRNAAESIPADSAAGMENTGIGLALAKEIIERHDGYITVESSEEKGTIFSIKFLKKY